MSWAHAGFRPPGPLFGDPAGDTAAGTYGASEPITILSRPGGAPWVVYSDDIKSSTISNVVLTDGVGNLSFYAEPGAIYEVSPDGVRTPNVIWPDPRDQATSAGLGIVPMTAWQPATAYVAGAVVTFTGQTWGCVTPHTSGAVFNAGEQANWVLMAGGGSGTVPAIGVTGPDAWGAAAVVGTGTSFARNDHDHGLPADPRGFPSTGTGLTGATATTRFVGGTASGPPLSGTFALGDLAVDQSGTLWVCTSAGTPGTWVTLPKDSLVVHLAGTETITGAKTFSALLTSNAGVSAQYLNLQGLTGATAASRYVGATNSGAPASGTFNTGDWTVDQTGTFWICTAGGTPGTWVGVPMDSAVVHLSGAEVISGAKTFSAATVFNAAVTGLSASWTGTDNAQVFAASGLPGATAASRNVGATASGAPASGTFAVGDWIVDQSGAFWVCTVGGTPGTWVKTGTAASISPASSTVGPETYGASPVTGTSLNYSRQDHAHGLPSNPTGLPLALTGATSATRYVGGTTSGAPASGTFAVGDFVIDRSGAVWICTVAGTPGTWKGINSDSGWSDVASGVGFLNSWVNFGPVAKAAYRKVGTRVTIKGVIKSGTVNTSAFVLPAGYRPPDNVAFAVDSNFAYGGVLVGTAGDVTMRTGNNTYFDLGNISFFID